MTTVEPGNPEDRKIITLAKAARARTQAAQGACVRDTDGRTYAATSVQLPHLALSGITVAVAMAVSSGAQGLEAVALAADAAPTEQDLAVVRDLPGSDVLVWFTNPQGAVQSKIEV
ncbi:MAG TPA: cytidine deaminase [Propionibacteriaceae bacterium]